MADTQFKIGDLIISHPDNLSKDDPEVKAFAKQLYESKATGMHVFKFKPSSASASETETLTRGQRAAQREDFNERLTDKEAQLEPTIAESKEPETTVDGFLGAIIREAGPTAGAAITGALLGSPGGLGGMAIGAGAGMAALGITKLTTDVIAPLLNNIAGTNQLTAQQALAAAFDSAGVPKPDSAAEKVFASSLRTMADTAESYGLGVATTAKGAIPVARTTTQRVANVLKDRPGTQMVGAATSGAMAEGADQIAEEAGMSPRARMAMQFAGGILGDTAGTGLASLARGRANRARARATDLEPKIAKKVEAVEQFGDVPTSMVYDPPTAAGAATQEIVKKLDPNINYQVQKDRVANINQLASDLDIADNTDVDQLLGEVAEDLYKERNQQLTTARTKKRAVIDDVMEKVSETTYEAVPVDKPLGGMQGSPTGTAIPSSTSRELGPPRILSSYEAGDSTTRRKIVEELWDITDGTIAETYKVVEVPGAMAVPTPKAEAAIEAAITKMNKAGAEGVTPMAQDEKIAYFLNDWSDAIKKKDLLVLDDVREKIGQSYSSAEEGMRARVRQESNVIYRALREDMADYVSANGTTDQVEAWENAHKLLSDLSKDYNNNVIASLLNRRSPTGEVIDVDLNLYDDSKGGIIDDMDTAIFGRGREATEILFRRLNTEGKRRLQTAVIAKMMQESSTYGNLSPNAFVKKLKDYGGKRGVLFSEEDGLQVEGLFEYLKATATAEGMAPGQRVPTEELGPGASYGLARFINKSQPLGTALAIGGKLGLKNITKWYEKPETRRLLMNLPSIKAADRASVNRRAEIGKRLLEIARSVAAASEDDQEQVREHDIARRDQRGAN